jgi:hypothetical protein
MLTHYHEFAMVATILTSRGQPDSPFCHVRLEDRDLRVLAL